LARTPTSGGAIRGSDRVPGANHEGEPMTGNVTGSAHRNGGLRCGSSFEDLPLFRRARAIYGRPGREPPRPCTPSCPARLPLRAIAKGGERSTRREALAAPGRHRRLRRLADLELEAAGTRAGFPQVPTAEVDAGGEDSFWPQDTRALLPASGCAAGRGSRGRAPRRSDAFRSLSTSTYDAARCAVSIRSGWGALGDPTRRGALVPTATPSMPAQGPRRRGNAARGQPRSWSMGRFVQPWGDRRRLVTDGAGASIPPRPDSGHTSHAEFILGRRL